MALGPFSAAVIVEALSEGGKKAFADIFGKAAGAAGRAVETKVMESLGGKGSIDDEIAYEALETSLTSDERLILKEFRDMKRTSFGTDAKAKKAFADWDHDYRQSVLKRRVPGNSKTATKTVKKKDGTVTPTEEDKGTPANKQPAIDFLKRFTEHIKAERDKWKSKAKIRQAGFAAGQEYLDRYNLPSDRPSAIGEQIKEAAASTVSAAGRTASAVSDRVAEVAPKIKRHTQVMGKRRIRQGVKVVEAEASKFMEHSDINNYNARKATRPGLVGKLSRIFG